jgi:hypothetical protein
MIDTVRYYQRRAYNYPVSLASIRKGGSFISGFKVECKGYKIYVVEDCSSGLRAGFAANSLYYVEVSLPRILFGHNGHLIAWQNEIDAALQKVELILNQFSTALDPARVYRRVDLVWQFMGDPSIFALAHRHCRHPMIHRPPIAYGNDGLEWRGSSLKIIMYDKLLQQAKRSGDVVRLEVQLRGRSLVRLLGNRVAVSDLIFSRCYKTYRTIIQKFSAKLVPKISNTLDLIAFGTEKYNLDLWPHWASTYKNPQSLNRARRQLLVRKLKYFGVNWSTLLPKGRPVWGAETDPSSGRTKNIFHLQRAVVLFQ